jgi:hypothetical protein
MSAPILFLDTETTGLHPGRRAWEVAMIRRDDEGRRETSFFVSVDLTHADPFGLKVGRFWDRHPVGRKLSGKECNTPGDLAPVLSQHDAAKEIMRWTFGAHIVGAVPNFDTETLAGLLRSQGYMPAWHYHLIDVENIAIGWLLGRQQSGWVSLDGDGGALDLTPPWSSDALSKACGVTAATEAERHTALGDARWVERWYDQMCGEQG